MACDGEVTSNKQNVERQTRFQFDLRAEYVNLREQFLQFNNDVLKFNVYITSRH